MNQQATRAILAEVFGIRLSAVDEMIENRFLVGDKSGSKKDGGLWPQEFWLERESDYL